MLYAAHCKALNLNVSRKGKGDFIMAETKPKKSTSKKAKSENDLLTYKGKPLLRCGNEIYYGNPEDKYVVIFRLEDNNILGDITVSKRVIIELKTNEGSRSQLIRQAEREGLYKALDLGVFWLEQALENG